MQELLTMSERDKKIKQLYLEGNSCGEIKDVMDLSITVRSIERIVVKAGIMRPMKQAFRNAIKRGRVHFAKKENKIKRLKISPVLRYKILARDKFRCVLCGATAKDRLLEVDHIDFNTRNNAEDNLRCLCEFCNFGRRPPQSLTNVPK